MTAQSARRITPRTSCVIRLRADVVAGCDSVAGFSRFGGRCRFAILSMVRNQRRPGVMCILIGALATRETGPVTGLLHQLGGGDKSALNQLLRYKELRMLADGYLRRERVGHTLQPTALVHEA